MPLIPMLSYNFVLGFKTPKCIKALGGELRMQKGGNTTGKQTLAVWKEGFAGC